MCLDLSRIRYRGEILIFQIKVQLYCILAWKVRISPGRGWAIDLTIWGSKMLEWGLLNVKPLEHELLWDLSGDVSPNILDVSWLHDLTRTRYRGEILIFQVEVQFHCILAWKMRVSPRQGVSVRSCSILGQWQQNWIGLIKTTKILLKNVAF